jgi:alkanesulfonate monooxygenase SsuD/methylene tetrahydromethanopterin reductase-like flavin-dependent oxidoreductase (luciferase family)
LSRLDHAFDLEFLSNDLLSVGPMFLMRFDMRAPGSSPASATDLYAAALDMAVWGEANGCLAVVLSEHHTSPDGYLPSPLPLAAAMAARTSTMPIQVAAVLLPFYEPVRLAEDMAVLDLLSGGRVSYIIGIGYRDEELAMFGVDRKSRGKLVERNIQILRKAWTGEPFDLDGRPAQVTPKPATPGGPTLLMGGSTAAAARRAARCGLGFYAQSTDPELETIYRAACAELRVEPGLCMVPPQGTVTAAFVAEDVDEAWERMGPCLLHDARMYASWLSGAAAASVSVATSVAELRAERGAYRIFSIDEAVEYVRRHGVLVTHPLCGGLPPELAWRSLRLIAEKVLPAAAA